MTRVCFASPLPCALALAATLWLSPTPASACSCTPPEPPRQALAHAAAVFEGRVVSIEAAESQAASATVHMRVLRSWKAADAEEITVTTGASSAACGFGFQPGENYMVYADAVPGGLRVSLCSRTQPIEAAQEDIQVLGMGATPVDPNGPPSIPDAPAEQQPPARGGCASCSVGTGERDARGASAALLLVGLAAARLSRRRRSRRARRAPPLTRRRSASRS